jgi:hypothetical protein
LSWPPSPLTPPHFYFQPISHTIFEKKEHIDIMT